MTRLCTKICDYSLQAIKSRAAKVGDKLVTRNFGTGTTGFCDVSDPETAVCILPGTELAFDNPVIVGMYYIEANLTPHTTAIFSQVHKDEERVHHDQLGFPDGTFAMLTHLTVGQYATVLQMPAAPKTEAEVELQRRASFAG